MAVEALGSEFMKKLNEHLTRSKLREQQYKRIISDLEKQLEESRARIMELEAVAAFDEITAHEGTESDVPSTQVETQVDNSHIMNDVEQEGAFQPVIFKETVRQKAARRQLHGHDCPCCRKYYEAVGKAERIESISRHRYRKEDPGTPEGFWNVRFSQT